MTLIINILFSSRFNLSSYLIKIKSNYIIILKFSYNFDDYKNLQITLIPYADVG